MVRAKVEWYKSKKDWPNYIPNLVTQVEKYGPREVKGFTVVWLNNAAWHVFQYSNDQTALAKALAWSDRALKALPMPATIDTYANLLYKLGRTDEAMLWEELAVKLEPNIQEFAGTLAKMKRGEPTWPQP